MLAAAASSRVVPNGMIGRNFKPGPTAEEKAAKQAAEQEAYNKALDAIPKDYKYPYVFSFKGHTDDLRLLKYDDILQSVYHRILRNALVSTTENNPNILINSVTTIPFNKFLKSLIEVAPQINTRIEQIQLFCIFEKQYGNLAIDFSSCPPPEYPDVSIKKEKDALLPPLYKVPGYTTEGSLDSAMRIFRHIVDESTNPNISGKTIKEAYTYLSIVKRVITGNISESSANPQEGMLVRQAVADIAAMKKKFTTEHVSKSELLFKVLMNDHTISAAEKLTSWTQYAQLKGLLFLHDIDRNPDRWFAYISPTWREYIDNIINGSFYTYEKGYSPLIGEKSMNNTLVQVKDRNQQIFIGVPSSAPLDAIIYPFFSEPVLKVSDTAWIKFNYNFGLTDVTDGSLRRTVKFQGYRLEDMPPPPILKAFAHGPPVDMAPHVKELFKEEWLRPDTLAAWLDKVMIKWRSDISRMAAKLKDTLCVDGKPNDDTWHFRDVPTIQLDLYNDVLAYIATQRGVPVESLRRQYETGPKAIQGGGRRKIAVKSKRMTRRSKQTRRQRGGAATGMPLAYFQDGAQMRGTYAEPTGVGLAGSTNTMARVGISQTGGVYRSGCRQGGGKRSGHRQNGGFIPSVMGPVVQNGAYLMPLASYMGYKMLKGRKGSRTIRANHSGSRFARRTAGRTSRARRTAGRFASRGPRATQKKRRGSRRN